MIQRYLKKIRDLVDDAETCGASELPKVLESITAVSEDAVPVASMCAENAELKEQLNKALATIEELKAEGKPEAVAVNA